MQSLSALLDELLEQPDGAARERWLAQRPPSQQPLLRRLMKARQAPAGLLDRSPIAMLAGNGPPSSLHAGQRVGRYLLLRELGHGGMSEVWLARPAADPAAAEVALKLPAVSLASTRFLERLARERRILEQLDHPRIARLVDAGVGETGQQYLALAYVDGQSLVVYCDGLGLGVDARLDLMLQVLDAVQYAHERQVLHRDLKPSNILVTREGEARLLDFGIAKLLVEGQAEETQLTERWGRALTPAYASPEQLTGVGVTVRSDLYALGVILYELMTGSRPPPADRGPHESPLPPSRAVRAEAAVARAEGGAQPLARRLERDLDELVLQTLQADPALRPPSAAALAERLRSARRGVALRPWPLRAWRSLRGLGRRRRRALAWAAPAWLGLGVLAPVHPLAGSIETWFLAPPPPERRVVLVTIGAEDHRRLFDGQRPLEASRVQELVERILEGAPARLGVDLDTSSPAFRPLSGALGRAALERIVWARELDSATPPETGQARPALRAVLGAVEPDPAVRSALAVAPSHSSDARLRWYAQAIDTASGRVPTLGAALAGRNGGDTALRAVRFVATERVELPASVVMAPGFRWGDRLRGRTVLLGGRYDAADEHTTPLGLQAGVDVLAHTTETEAAGGGYLRPGITSRLLIGLVPCAGTLWAADRFGAWRGLALGVAFALATTGLLWASGVFEGWSYGLLALIAAPLAALGPRASLRR